MNKLSEKSIDKINLFLNDNKFNYVTLSKREVKTLYNAYKKATSEIFELENNNEHLLNQNKQKDKAIDECIDILGQYEHHKLPNEEQILRNKNIVYNVLGILEKMKGGYNE